jgi:hypothetical protein
MPAPGTRQVGTGGEHLLLAFQREVADHPERELETICTQPAGVMGGHDHGVST